MIIGMSCFLHKKTIYHKQQKIHMIHTRASGGIVSVVL